MTEPRILRAKDAAAQIGLSVWSLYRFAATGDIGCVRSRSGRLLGFTVGQLDEWVRTHTHAARGDEPAAPLPTVQAEPVYDGPRVFD